ncbi:hypothetical protein L3X38_001807 [Prunus dulcis]|uniref:Transposable element protein n=1 Tax=Prunus dulcis TaxID=3755 RepID=A0AAD4WSQ0_PRUDU|nr:hypothetical protein L3X38_001807 [Prunus dulcis]
MMCKYEMSDLGLLHHFLGMGVTQTEGSIFIHQRKYALTLLDKYGLKDCKPKNCWESSVLATRPDIIFSASLLARFMHKPSKKHYGAAKRVLRYIQGTIDFGIEYVVGKSALLIGYCDSDWSGLVKQHSVALSTAEAEYVSAAEATSQAIWLRFVLEDFGEEQVAATALFCDNTSAITMSKNPVFH